MKAPQSPNSRVSCRICRPAFALVLLVVSLLMLAPASGRAGSATWNLNPTSGLWDTAANWTPATVPNAPSDTATFDVSSITSVFSGPREINGITFNSGASAFTITINSLVPFTMSGTGVVNNSGILQKFVVSPEPAESGNAILAFANSATAGSNIEYTAVGASTVLTYGGEISFLDDSSAGFGTFIVEGGRVHDSSSPGALLFSDSATAGDATIINNGGLFGGFVDFGYSTQPTSSAGNALFITNGGSASGEVGGFTAISQGGTATLITNGGSASGAGGAQTLVENSGENATFVINGGTNGGDGGRVSFSSESTAEDARFEIFGNGLLDISTTSLPPPAIGSIEGDGLILVGTGGLTVGNNDLTTTFAGEIRSAHPTLGAVIKVGHGILTLSGANTYPEGTTINAGALAVSNVTDSGTGSGPVQVNGGILGGIGKIAGAATIGDGGGANAHLKPSVGTKKPARLTIQSSLTFKADSIYSYLLNTRNARADEVVSDGVTIESGGQFHLHAIGNQSLTVGQVLIPISNTSDVPISGNFSNLEDGSTLTVGNNTFQVSYEGGDGNDLTLTVQ
jgi:autotransporter-associated beta strand protein